MNGEGDPDPLLAQQMGFSSFGAQPLPKKRKPNPAGGGGNRLPLGKGRNPGRDRAADVIQRSRTGGGAGPDGEAHVPDATDDGGSGGGAGRTWRGGGTEPDRRAPTGGVRDGNGDVAYYDPSFVEDPWAELLKGRIVGGGKERVTGMRGEGSGSGVMGI